MTICDQRDLRTVCAQPLLQNLPDTIRRGGAVSRGRRREVLSESRMREICTSGSFRSLHACSGCFRLERIAGWASHPLESAALSRRTPIPDLSPATCNSARGGELCPICDAGFSKAVI